MSEVISGEQSSHKTRASLKFTAPGADCILAVSYQAISSSLPDRRLHKPDHGGSLRGRRLFRKHHAQGDMGGEPSDHNLRRHSEHP